MSRLSEQFKQVQAALDFADIHLNHVKETIEQHAHDLLEKAFAIMPAIMAQVEALESKTLSESRLVEAVNGLYAHKGIKVGYITDEQHGYILACHDAKALIRQQAIEAKQDVPGVSALAMKALRGVLVANNRVLESENDPEWIKAVREAILSVSQPAPQVSTEAIKLLKIAASGKNEKGWDSTRGGVIELVDRALSALQQPKQEGTKASSDTCAECDGEGIIDVSGFGDFDICDCMKEKANGAS